MSVTELAGASYSMKDDRDELRAEFDEQFDWDDSDTHQVDSCWCAGSGSDAACCD